MLVFAASDKGGTGRSVTSCNVVYRRALAGAEVCYLDFDFGSPTAGSIFQIVDAARGVREGGGLHSYLMEQDPQAAVEEPRRIDVWNRSARASLRHRPPGSGQLMLFPGDQDGGEFRPDKEALRRCVRLLLALDEEFDMCLVDLSAGRSYATQLVLEATADPALHGVVARWLVFHRWTRQHIPAAAGLVYGRDGILDVGERAGHDRDRLAASIRFVRTAVVDPDSAELRGLRPAQVAWLRDCDQDLRRLAARHRVGRLALLGSVPLDPVLQWREQLLSDNDVVARDIANLSTVAAFDELARNLVDDEMWATA
ncbi:SCO2523 family variant P-loop protein [Micromonospora sagamiensis]|uniref:CobQ/CobB/MinD/ParA nucleotide binding domain-containing protein n=1 Tax=Micromonospora sagamiensis TaxID=47875 RepID=A0A562WF11_9ACTN|nr:SCO2523 family variant P-loop protein [Micromonospora sagamiensis]TWJ28806.1 CobQ/CobB/MinD/ParA nucleotide binding domain-containing protein [Micromonospora sagamiensis]BCL12288.1 DNA-binding protein [Micromonospora sagamiensis]